MNKDILVAIDFQTVFAHPESPWHTIGFRQAAERARTLISAFRGPVIYTRFLPMDDPEGAWQQYYRKWDFTQHCDPDWWNLVSPWAHAPSIDLHTLSKWGQELAAVADPGDALILTGVTTDCCVLSTALAAIDAGVHVRVAADACASDPEAHASAIDLLHKRAPLVTVTTVGEELTSLEQTQRSM